MSKFFTFTNGNACTLQSIPVLEYADFATCLKEELNADSRICAFFGVPKNLKGNTGQALRLYILLARNYDPLLAVGAMDVDTSYDALTPEFPALHLFEREIYEQFKVLPKGHPWLKPVRFNGSDSPQIGVMDFFKVEGADVHEVAVGPIHAGVIECGHFRFQCLGETVMHLEISLGYQHRGLEEAFNQGLHSSVLPLMETLAGDSTIAHTWAFATLRESLTRTQVTPRAQTIRAIALELERLANHTGDLGALAGDMGFLPTASFCGRLRGDFLNITALLCGSRFGRGLLTPGGVNFDLDDALCNQMEQNLRLAVKDVQGAVNLLWDTPSVTSRMLEIGVVSKQTAKDLGLVGLAARASGLRCDTRITHPLPLLQEHNLTMNTQESGDVYARGFIRQSDIQQSAAFISSALGKLRALPDKETVTTPLTSSAADTYGPPSAFAAALVEGWRGEVCHAVLTDEKGQLQQYKVVDPSFHNWAGLAMALRGGQISDFPLCNKSFNLSYCGVDL